MYTSQQVIARLTQIHPAGSASIRGNNSEPDVGVGCAGLGIALQFERSPQSAQIDLGILHLMTGIELHIGNSFGIGRPPICRSEVEFLRVHPIQLCIQQGGPAVTGKPCGLARSDFEGVEIMLAPESLSGIGASLEKSTCFAFSGTGLSRAKAVRARYWAP